MEGQCLQTCMDGLDCISNNLFWNQLYLSICIGRCTKKVLFKKTNFHKLINSINKTIYLSSKSRDFEKAAMFCENNSSLIPLTFVLAFYVSHVVSRWWAQWNAIPWPDGLAFKINSYCSGLVCLIEEKKLIISSLPILLDLFWFGERSPN